MNRKEKFINLIKDINDGNWDEYSDMFRYSFSLFLSVVKKYELLDYLDLESGSAIMEEHENAVLFALIQLEPDKYYKYIRTELINSDLCGDDNDFLCFKDIEDLAEFFDDGGRDTSPYSAAKNVLGDGDWDSYYDTVNDIYDDVIDDLNDINLKILKDTMFKVLDGISVEAYTDTLSELKTNEDDDEVIITSENFDAIFEDEDTVKYLLKNADELDEIKSNLHSIYNNAYNSAYYDEIYTDVWNELDTYFEGKVEYHSKPNKYDSKKTVNWYTIKIRDVNHLIYTWLKEEQKSTYNDDKLGYYGSFSGVLKEAMKRGYYDFLDFRVPDYPDYGRIKKNLNEIFTDYI